MYEVKHHTLSPSRAEQRTKYDLSQFSSKDERIGSEINELLLKLASSPPIDLLVPVTAWASFGDVT